MNWAHRHVRITVSSTALLGAPAITMVCAAIFIDEPIKIAQVVGGAIVIAAVAAVIRPRHAAHRPPRHRRRLRHGLAAWLLA